MKKPVIIFLICLTTGILSAQKMAGGRIRVSPSISNTSIRSSERASARQSRNFGTHTRYSSAVNSHRAKAARKQQAKANSNKDL